MLPGSWTVTNLQAPTTKNTRKEILWEHRQKFISTMIRPFTGNADTVLVKTAGQAFNAALVQLLIPGRKQV